jgi:hypothetical protein
MKELHYDTLRKALGELPIHEAPADIWLEIAKVMDEGKVLHQTLVRMPQHQAPDLVWERIAGELSADRSAAIRPRAKTVSMRWWMSAAAAVILLLVGAWWVLQPAIYNGVDSPAVVMEIITQDTIDTAISAIVEESEDAGFAYIQTLCEQKIPLCEAPEFKELKMELDELTEAKNELRIAIGQFGDDPDLATQLVRIEQERSELLQQIMEMI